VLWYIWTWRSGEKLDSWASNPTPWTLFSVDIDENRAIHQGSRHKLARLCFNNTISIADLWPASFILSAFEKRFKVHRSD